jgi:hypothetical protein
MVWSGQGLKVSDEQCTIQPAMRALCDLKSWIGPSIPFRLLLGFVRIITLYLRLIVEIPNRPLIGDADQNPIFSQKGVFGE